MTPRNTQTRPWHEVLAGQWQDLPLTTAETDQLSLMHEAARAAWLLEHATMLEQRGAVLCEEFGPAHRTQLMPHDEWQRFMDCEAAARAIWLLDTDRRIHHQGLIEADRATRLLMEGVDANTKTLDKHLRHFERIDQDLRTLRVVQQRLIGFGLAALALWAFVEFVR